MPEETVVLKVFVTEIDGNMARDVLKDEGIYPSIFKDDGGGWNLIFSGRAEFVW